MFCSGCGKQAIEDAPFCSGCGKSLSAPSSPSPTTAPSAPPTPRRSAAWAVAQSVLIACGVLFIGGIAFTTISRYIVTHHETDTVEADAPVRPVARYIPRPEPVYVPRRTVMFSNQTVVLHGNMVFVKFTVDAEKMRNVRVTGHFNAAGGRGNDIEAFLADADNFENLRNGHQANTLYFEPRTTVGTVDVPVNESGTYYFGFSNQFSALTNKYVYGTVELSYEQRAGTTAPASY